MGGSITEADQACPPTMNCTKCVIAWTHPVDGEARRSVYAPLVPKWSEAGEIRTWCCSSCGSSYGVQPHPDLRDLSDDKKEPRAIDLADPSTCEHVLLVTGSDAKVFFSHRPADIDWLVERLAFIGLTHVKVLSKQTTMGQHRKFFER